ncbi:CBN-LSY-13 protein [Caenorhabditis brenneri]|uniref:CBN-LSY-13 protein n=1 Tax=Caenorhabditis brenneri TaxID=135651 RepID=G0MR14_CAEBE|nr:CBN-LSY-13 protein [Caenorhabditis brenneri]
MSAIQTINDMAEFFAEINQEVPKRTKEALAEIEKLDQLAKKKAEEVHRTKVEFLAHYGTMTDDSKSKAFAMLLSQVTQISDLSAKKVDIAQDAYTDACQIYDEFKIKRAKFIENCPRSPWKSPVNPAKSKSTGEDENDGIKKEKKKRGKKRKDVPSTSDAVIKMEEGADENMEGGEEKDPKTYCWCQLEKDDQMVCCENPSCKYEWYHFTCIGMEIAPVGDWYCTECREFEQRVKKEEEQPGPSERKVGTTPARRGPKKKRFN